MVLAIVNDYIGLTRPPKRINMNRAGRRDLMGICFPQSCKNGTLAVFAGRFDESYDENQKVFAVGGYLGRNEDWLELEPNIQQFLDKHNLRYFKASECEFGRGEFLQLRDNPNEPNLPLTPAEKTRLKATKTEFVSITNSCNIWGIGATVLLEHFKSVLLEKPQASPVLSEHPYFLCFQAVIAEVAAQVNEVNHKLNFPRGSRAEMVAFVFDENGEPSGKAKEIYDGFQLKNPDSSECMGSLSYASDLKFVLLQAADNFAYETMKGLLNSRYDKGRVERKAMTRLKEKTWKIYVFDKPSLEMVVEHNLRREAIEATVLDQPGKNAFRGQS